MLLRGRCGAERPPKADVIFVLAVEFALKAAVEAQRPIPIVMAAINFDPVAKGYVQSLARPGGNITGLDTRWTEITAKQVEVMQEAFPDRNLGVMWDALSIEQLRAAEREAKAKGLELRAFKLENPPYDFAPAFRALAQDGAQMVLIGSSPLFSRYSVRTRQGPRGFSVGAGSAVPSGRFGFAPSRGTISGAPQPAVAAAMNSSDPAQGCRRGRRLQSRTWPRGNCPAARYWRSARHWSR